MAADRKPCVGFVRVECRGHDAAVAASMNYSSSAKSSCPRLSCSPDIMFTVHTVHPLFREDFSLGTWLLAIGFYLANDRVESCWRTSEDLLQPVAAGR